MNQQLLIVLGISVVGLVIYFASRKSKPEVKGKSILESYSEHGQVWVKQMCQLYDSGLTWDKDPQLLYEKTFGITLAPNEHGQKYSAYWNDIGVDRDYLNAEETSSQYRIGAFAHDIEMGLSLRFAYQYKPLTSQTESEVMKEFGLNIDSDELLYYSSKKIDWYEEKVVSTNVSYSGFRYRPGGQMSFSTGTFHVIKNNISDYILLDRGSLYITNKRVIFIGDESRQNRIVKINDILELSIYKDGVLLGKANGKQPLIFVPNFQNELVARDNFNWILRVLDRVMSGTQDQDLTPVDFNLVN
ncbi:MAG: hypothetical protein ABI723_19410 [Bacteroidia bacterium]